MNKINLMITTLAISTLAVTAFGDPAREKDYFNVNGYAGINAGFNANKAIAGITIKQDWLQLGWELGWIFMNSSNELMTNSNYGPVNINYARSNGFSVGMSLSAYLTQSFYITSGIGVDSLNEKFTFKNSDGGKGDGYVSNSRFYYQAGIGYQPVSWLKIEPMYYNNQKAQAFIISTKFVF